MSKAVFEICIYRNDSRFNDLANMREHEIERDGVIGEPAGESKAGGRSGNRLKLQVLEIKSASNIPRVRDNEATALMQGAKERALFSSTRPGFVHAGCSFTISSTFMAALWPGM